MRARTSRIYTRVVVMSTMLWVLDVIELCRVLPDILHSCRWPAEEVMGGAEDALFAEIVLSAVLQTLNLVVVLLWFFRDTYPSAPAGTFDVWESLGLHRRRVPVAVDVLQGLSIVVQLLLVGFLQPTVIVLALLKMALNGLVLCRSILVPSALCYESHRVTTLPGERDGSKGPAPRPLGPGTFYEHTRVLVLASTIMTLAFLALFLMPLVETFGAGPKLYRSTQLRLLNDDRAPYNQGLAFHAQSLNLSRALQAGRLPMRRVVLVVLDGLGVDELMASAAWQRLLQRRAPAFWVRSAEALLPTMSAPNWLTLLSGARPEVTGLHGNSFVGETEFDTVFSRMSRLDTLHSEFARGLAACPWWGELVRSSLPRVRGNGVVQATSMMDVVRKFQPLPGVEWQLTSSEQLVRPPYTWFQELQSATQESLTDDATDRYRTHLACEALNDTRGDPYRFYLLHQAAVDTTGHADGLAGSTFARAVAQSAAYVDEVLRVVDATPWARQTTVVITSDHGHVEAGGHGGSDAVLKRVPLLVYHAGSSNPTRGGWEAHTTTLYLDDVAPTLTTLLGLPVPRQATGTSFASQLPPEVHQRTDEQLRWHALDAYEAKRELTNALLLQLSVTSRQWCALDDWALLQRNTTWTRQASTAQLLQAARQLDDVYARWRSFAHDWIVARNVCVAFLLVFFSLYAMAYLLSKHSLLRPTPLRSLAPTVVVEWGNTSGPATVPSPLLEHTSWVAGVVAFGLTATYLLVVLGVVLVDFYARGYMEWNSTFVHSIGPTIHFMVITLVPGSLFQLLLIRLYHVPWLQFAHEPLSRRDAKTPGMHVCRALVVWTTNVLRVLFVEIAYAQGHCVDLLWVYFVRLYMMYFAFVLWSIWLVLHGATTFWFPFAYSNWVLTDTNWTLRFRLVTLGACSIALLVGNLAAVCSFSRKNAHQIRWDRLFVAQPAVALSLHQHGALHPKPKRKTLPQSHLAVQQAFTLPTRLIPPGVLL